MIKIKKFETQAVYEATKSGLILPNVSLTVDNNTVHYNPYDPYNGYDYIEIGGLKWATKNVGANNITDTGFFFHWADTQGYTPQQCINGEMTLNYKYCNEDDGITEEYINNYYNWEIERNYGNMLSSDDAAKAIMHGNWRIPTPEEWQSLVTNTTISFTSNYNNSNVPGYIFTDKLDNTKVLFIPAIGEYQGWYDSESGFPYADGRYSYGTQYWTNAWSEEFGYTQYFSYDGEDATTDDGYNPIGIKYGLPIRAVAN